MFKLIFFSLFSHLAIGGLLPLLFISLDEIGTMFFRFISILSAIFLFFALLAQPFGPQLQPASSVFSLAASDLLTGLLIFSIVALIAGCIWLKRLRKSYLWLALIVGVAALLVSAASFPAAATATQSSFAVKAFSFAGSAFLLGSVMTAMITGHWYLVNHRLTIQPLKVASWLFLAATIVRVLFVIGLMSASVFSELTTGIAQNLLSLSGEGMIFWARVAIGLVGPLIFGIMIYETVKLRSTQSATGILYAAVVMVFIGEAFSKFLWFFTGIPV